MKALFRLSLFAALLLVLSCSLLPNHKDDFAKKNDDFMLRVRWLDFQGASLHFDEENRQKLVEQFADNEDLKVTDFSMTRLDIDVPNEKVTAHYRLQYYMLPSATVETERFTLTWEQRSGEESAVAYWRIVEPFPELD